MTVLSVNVNKVAVLRNARGGDMDLTLRPTGESGVYRGNLRIGNTRIVEAPALTELLSAISIIGLLDQMNSGGITLTDVDAEFQLDPNRLTLYRSSATGPSIGVSLDGVYDLQRSRIDLLVGLAEPLRVEWRDGPFQLYEHRQCRVETMVVVVHLPHPLLPAIAPVERSVLKPLTRGAAVTRVPV